MTDVHAASTTSPLIDAQLDGASKSVTGVLCLYGQYYRITGELEFEFPTANDGITEKLMPPEVLDELVQNELNHSFRPFGYQSSSASCRYFILRSMERLHNTDGSVLLPDDVWSWLHKELVAEWDELDPSTLHAWRKEFSEQWWTTKRFFDQLA